MADALPNPETLTRQPGAPSAGGEVPQTIEFDEQISPEQALEEARAQKQAAERERDNARAREATLQRERDEALSREAQAGTRAVTAQEQALTTAITAHTNIVEQAKIAYANARAAADTMAETEALEQLTDAKAALRDLNNQKSWLEQQKTAPVARQTQPDGVTVRLPNGASMQASHEAKAWMDEHPRFYEDRAYFNHAVAAHQSIKDDGIAEGSPAYFRALSDHMQEYERYEAFRRGDIKESPMQEQQNGRTRQQPRISAAAMGAPVSRGTQPTQRSGGVPDENAIARKIGCDVSDLRDFARISGFTAQRYGGDATAAYNAYLKSHQEIGEIERINGDTGLRVDGAWR
jgi:hypothetical protein